MLGSAKKREKKWADFEAEALPLMPDVFRVARWLARDLEIAEDMTQETFTQALKSFDRYQAGTNCIGWLLTILYRINGKRKMKLGRLKLVNDPEIKLPSRSCTKPPIPERLTDEDVLAAFERIPEKFAEAVMLTDVESLSYKEASEVLQVPIGTVMSRLHRGRRLLRSELADYARGHGLAAEG